MSHLDDQTIALRALGEDPGPEASAHLAGCATCRDEVGALQRVTTAARAGAPRLDVPDERVWQHVAEELGLDRIGADGVVTDEVDADPDDADEPHAPIRLSHDVPAPTSWWRRPVWVAAAGFVLGAAVTAGALTLGGEGEPPVVATAELDPLPGHEVTGTAAVHDVDGRQVLRVELPDPGGAGFLEVWLLDADAQRLVSLGILTGTEGTFDLPVGLDLSEFPVVDVSEEPFDGDPAHSGDSIVRGTLA
ncbi:anti-sigma factor [Occultella glacieicola]|uniref:Anti-sigma factor n=1 Tax=Occultella glacieicola TaxID=2518684 RepID=A0ABY2E2B1_9MICO|nr:anti-sigma factor [Occultella glacieicola]TDE92744.1 anti-sigma factor [Occultella glacieicola]